jgi:hypothetical protein
MKYTKGIIWLSIIILSIIVILYVMCKTGYLETFDDATNIAYNNAITLQKITGYLSNTQADQTKISGIYNKLKRYRELLQNYNNYLTIQATNHDEPDFKASISCDIGEQNIQVLYPTGKKGVTGETGATGETGSQGPSGSQGAPGRPGQTVSYLTY